MPAMQLADTTKITGKAQELLTQFDKGMGLTPNLFKQMANSPAALEAFLGAKDSLSRGLLDAKMQAMIGIVVAESYSCEYMLSACVAVAKKVGLTDEEIRLAKNEVSTDPKVDLGLSFVRNLVLRHGELPDADVPELRTAGYTDGEIIELVVNTSLNMCKYYLIQIAQPVVDFPVVATAFPV
jgi:alkylhydroperoxidase family enzyme